MENKETIPPNTFSVEDAEQFWVSAAVVLNPNNRTLVNDEWYERHLELFFDFTTRYPNETKEILEYLSQERI